MIYINSSGEAQIIDQQMVSMYYDWQFDSCDIILKWQPGHAPEPLNRTIETFIRAQGDKTDLVHKAKYFIGQLVFCCFLSHREYLSYSELNESYLARPTNS